jgi:hypothetical protein
MSISSSVMPARSAAALVASIATALDKLLRICGVVPYALVVLGLHVITARVFFPSGQMKIAGPVIPMSLFNCDGDFSVVLPAEIRPSTFELFQTQYAGARLPVRDPDGADVG